MHTIIEKIKEIGIVPIVVLEDSKDAVPLAEALCEGGLPCAEITFRTKAAKECIEKMVQAFPNMLIGAGTILNEGQVDCAVEAGAKFIVTPGFNPQVVSHCVEQNIAITPGCVTPSEIEMAIKYNLNVVKFFPAQPSGGLEMIKALAAPYRQIRFMPTGGISPENVGDYLAFEKVIACGGSWMVKDSLIQSGDFAAVTRLAKEAVQLVQRSRRKESFWNE